LKRRKNAGKGEGKHGKERNKQDEDQQRDSTEEKQFFAC